MPEETQPTTAETQAAQPASEPTAQQGNTPEPTTAETPKAEPTTATDGHEPAAQVSPATVGRIVHFGLRTERGNVVSRPAMVVCNHGDGGKPGLCVNLQVFTDGANDFSDGRACMWATSVLPYPPGTAGAWWWPPRE